MRLRQLALSFLAGCLLTVAALPAAGQQAGLTGPALGAALRSGGLVLFFRHAATTWSDREEGPLRLEDCSTQRNLSDVGRADARSIGEAARALGIIMGTVTASPFCRTRETAELAFGPTALNRDLMWPGSGASPAVRADHKAKVTALVAAVPAAGKTNIVVSHGFVVNAVAEIQLAEGEAVVLRPNGSGGFTMVGRILPSDWSALGSGKP